MVLFLLSNEISELKNDYESNASFSDFHSRGITDDIDNMNILYQEIQQESIRNDQGFLQMNNQIRGLTTMVEAFDEQLNSNKTYRERNTPSNGEEITPKAFGSTTNTDSDNVVKV